MRALPLIALLIIPPALSFAGEELTDEIPLGVGEFQVPLAADAFQSLFETQTGLTMTRIDDAHAVLRMLESTREPDSWVTPSLTGMLTLINGRSEQPLEIQEVEEAAPATRQRPATRRGQQEDASEQEEAPVSCDTLPAQRDPERFWQIDGCGRVVFPNMALMTVNSDGRTALAGISGQNWLRLRALVYEDQVVAMELTLRPWSRLDRRLSGTLTRYNIDLETVNRRSISDGLQHLLVERLEHPYNPITILTFATSETVALWQSERDFFAATLTRFAAGY